MHNLFSPAENTSIYVHSFLGLSMLASAELVNQVNLNLNLSLTQVFLVKKDKKLSGYTNNITYKVQPRQKINKIK